MRVPAPTPVRAGDLPRLVLLPPAVLLGARALLWMAGFGQEPPERLPLVALAVFGVLLADAAAAALRRSGGRGTWALAGGATAAVALATVLSGLAVRDLVAPAAMLAMALPLAALGPREGTRVGAMSVFVAATVLANYTLDAFLPVGPWFLVNVGTLFFGVTFTQRDRIHRFGRRAVYGTILVAALANVAAALAVGTPLRYVAVSFLAIVASETADTEIYQRLLRRRWLVRVASSNAVSAPLDTVLFTVLAFAGAPFATLAWMTQVIVTDVLVKYASGLATALALLGGRAALPEPVEA
ncbi:MAG: hypothetical protein GVY27_13615 [Deinococcus-Thermus bacterium]|jgi:uncharacterized PurR-regulated membrane protein YhhQ (DUF165 family)|nr:hypothetical protein [Deinococcota bacterium]